MEQYNQEIGEIKDTKYLQKQLEYFKMWKSTFGMPTEAVNLFKCIQEKQVHKFTGKQVAQILKDLKTEKEIQKFNEVKIKNRIKEVLEKMEQTKKMIREMYSGLNGDILKQDVKKPEIIQEFKISQVPQIETKQKMEIKQEVKKSVIKQEFRVPKILQLETKQKVEIKQEVKKPVIKQEFRIPKLFLKIKQTYFENVNKILKNLKEMPIDLQIKWNDNLRDLKQFAESLKNPNLKSLRNVTLYYPYLLGDSDRINIEKLISSSLLSLPDLSSVKIIAVDIKSLDGFKSLGRKLFAQKDKEWRNRQKWQW